MTRSLAALAVLSSFAFVPFVACSSSNGSTATTTTPDAATSTPVTLDQGCTDLAAAYCTKLQSCAGFFLTLQYGDVNSCKTRFKLACVVNGSSPNSGNTGDNYEACAVAAPAITCPDLFTDSLPLACQPIAGKATVGAACTDDGQCTTSFCGKDDDTQVCGVCATPAAAGTPCANGGCPNGLKCSKAGTCAKSGVLNDLCDDGHPCIASLVCFGGKCTTPGSKDATCDIQNVTAPGCDLLQGLFCNVTTKKCDVTTTGATAGVACGLDTKTGIVTFCDRGTYCSIAKSTDVAGTCKPRGADGAGCVLDAFLGAGPCSDPAKCVNRVCQLPDPTTCK